LGLQPKRSYDKPFVQIRVPIGSISASIRVHPRHPRQKTVGIPVLRSCFPDFHILSGDDSADQRSHRFKLGGMFVAGMQPTE
jgi:hypothetical protein